MEEKARHFDDNSRLYNNVRPGYPDEVYDTIAKHFSFDSNSHILEIGAGNGTASREIYEKWHPRLTLVEPGRNFCDLLHEKFNDVTEIKIENTTFEQYETESRFDAIFSATAFHWLDPSTKYKKSSGLLKPGGLLILYWNNYGIKNEELAHDIQKTYIKYGMGKDDGKSVADRTMEKIESRKNEIAESGYFALAEHRIIKKTKEYSADSYIQLLKTFSDHVDLDKGFFDEITEKIKKNGNKIEGQITVNLEIGKKK